MPESHALLLYHNRQRQDDDHNEAEGECGDTKVRSVVFIFLFLPLITFKKGFRLWFPPTLCMARGQSGGGGPIPKRFVWLFSLYNTHTNYHPYSTVASR